MLVILYVWHSRITCVFYYKLLLCLLVCVIRKEHNRALGASSILHSLLDYLPHMVLLSEAQYSPAILLLALALVHADSIIGPIRVDGSLLRLLSQRHQAPEMEPPLHKTLPLARFLPQAGRPSASPTRSSGLCTSSLLLLFWRSACLRPHRSF